MSALKTQKSKLDGVLLIDPPTKFEDFRGEYIALYNEKIYKEAGIKNDFVEDDISVSSRNVLRGIHGDPKTTKLISCLSGKFYLVVVNNIKGHRQFGQWDAFTLSDKNRLQVLIPAGFGNGHVVLSDFTIFHYKQDNYYGSVDQFTLMWDDARLNIWWPVKAPIVSRRDQDS